MIYEPAEDSFLLEGEVHKRAKGLRVLDMGSGSGILARAALETGAKQVLCVDIDPEVVEHLSQEGFEVVESNLFDNVKGKWDLIVFNPPYLPADEREDAESARVTSGGKKGDEIILRFLRKVGKHLVSGGIVLLLVSSLTPLARIERILLEKIFVWKVISSEKVFMESLEVWEIRKS